jgi:hypothetical protein
MGCERHRVQCFVDDPGDRNFRRVIDLYSGMLITWNVSVGSNSEELSLSKCLPVTPDSGHRSTQPACPKGAGRKHVMGSERDRQLDGAS